MEFELIVEAARKYADGTKHVLLEDEDGYVLYVSEDDIFDDDGDPLIAPVPIADWYPDAQQYVEHVKGAVRSEIDRMSEKLTTQYTGTEEKGWIVMLAEAQAYHASGDPADAPGIALDAAIRGDTVEARASAILEAAEVTELLPYLASGMRAKAEQLIDATDGSEAAVTAVTDMLKQKAQTILEAALSRDKEAIIAAATDWGE